MARDREGVAAGLKEYDPEKRSGRELMRDWGVVVDWYASLKKGEKIPHTKEDVLNMGRLVYQELKTRNIKFRFDSMGDYSRQLYKEVSGEVTPDELAELDELRYFRDFSIVKTAVSMVGSTVNSRFSKYDDIDILVRLREPRDSYLRRAIEIRILKMLPPHLREKIHFIWGDPEGSHDEYIPLFDLSLTRVKPEIIEMHELAGTFKPFRPFKPLKTTEETYYEVDELLDALFDEEAKRHRWAIEKKYDGFRAVIHKQGDKVKIYSDQEKDITSAFPTAVEQVRKMNPESFIMDSEMVPYDKSNNPLGRNIAAKFIGAVKSGKKLDDSRIRFHVFDLLYIDGRSLGDSAFYERKKILNSLEFTDNVTQVYSIIAEKKSKVESSVKMLSKLPGSEGAMLKRYDSIYPTTGKTSGWVKYKKVSTIKTRVLDKHRVEGTKAYNYTVGIDVTPKQAKDIPPRYLDTVGGRKVLVLGNTFNTSIKAGKGDILEVQVEEVWRHETKKGIRYSIHKPNPTRRLLESETTDIDELDKLVVSKGVSIIQSENSQAIKELSEDDSEKLETYKKWKKLVNMSVREIREFYESEDGRDAGLSKEEAGKKGIKSGRESAEWLMRMIPKGGSFDEAIEKWTPTMWEWASRQISFISRMKGVKGPLMDDNKKTRKLKALMIWGHDPRKENMELQGDEGSPAPGEGRSDKVLKNFSARMQRHFREAKESEEKPRFVIQWHMRGRSVHTDVRHEIPGSNVLEGFTVTSPPSVDKPDEFTDKKADGLLTVVKTPQPKEWLTFEGFSKPGGVGATKHKPAWFIIVAKGTYEVKTVEDHRIIIQYNTEEGSVSQEIIEKAREKDLPVPKNMPKKYKQLTGDWLWQIAHLPEKHVVLLKRLKDDG